MAEGQNHLHQQRTLQDYFKPVVNENYSGIQHQQVNANNFELKPALVNMVQQNQYGGLPHEDPNIHLATFLEICDTVKINGLKEMLRKCPQHGIEDWFQVQLFYNRLTGQTKAHIDAAAGGTILSKTPGDALNLFEDMAMNSCQWQNERSTVKRAAGIYDVDQMTSLMAQMALLTNQIQGLTAVNANGN
ncbi:uncharacterized protein LOC112095390 [Morus notabilis]|uniref:uncharacterized protein LOC112095390 n=1 Tax=Morus notabilis TaxID=981085 RepID=UPI000CED2020|nr:uncharacterized protein LOC112095390 [Morus notabilis]